MPDDTRDIAIEARTDIKNILKMLQSHMDKTEAHRDGLLGRVQSLEGNLLEKVEVIETNLLGKVKVVEVELQKHHDLIQQIKGAKIAIASIVAAVTTVGVGAIAKLVGVWR
jgi:hypothetical protein